MRNILTLCATIIYVGLACHVHGNIGELLKGGGCVQIRFPELDSKAIWPSKEMQFTLDVLIDSHGRIEKMEIMLKSLPYSIKNIEERGIFSRTQIDILKAIERSMRDWIFKPFAYPESGIGREVHRSYKYVLQREEELICVKIYAAGQLFATNFPGFILKSE